MPEEMHDLIHYVMERTDGIGRAVLSVHCHNDLGLAVANSLAAVSAGACQVECTVNGIGERAGNAALEEIVMALHTRRDTLCASTGIHMRQIYRTSKLLYNIIGTAVPMNKPIVGANAFKHEAGIHQHGVLENTATYEIMSPETIGVPKNHMVLGKHSGKHAFQTRLSELGYSLSEEETARYFREFKTLCDKKKDITDSDLEAIVNNRVPDQHVYQLDRFDVHAGNFATASCVIRLKKGETVIEDVALGDGPIDAAYHAIDRIVCPPPHILDDYSIHSVSDGKDALGEVLVKIKCGEKVINGRGLSTDIIESSILAYLNAVNRLLSQS